MGFACVHFLSFSVFGLRSEFVTLRDIAFVHKKKKLTREERQAQIMVRISVCMYASF